MPRFLPALLILCLVARPARAQELYAPHWSSSCAGTGDLTGIAADSPSGDLSEDDMVLTLRWSDGTTTPLPLSPDWYKPLRIASNAPTLCTHTATFRLASGDLLLLLRRDGRPEWDRLGAVLIDPIRHRVRSIIDDLGEYQPAGLPSEDWALLVVRRGDAVDLHLVREYLQDATKSAEFAVPAWRRVRVSHGQLQVNWVP